MAQCHSGQPLRLGRGAHPVIWNPRLHLPTCAPHSSNPAPPLVPAGFYAQTLGEYGTAIAAFKSVLGYEDVPHLHPMAAITAALCELQRGASQAAVGRAAEVLEAAGISSRVDMADASQLRAAHDR